MKDAGRAGAAGGGGGGGGQKKRFVTLSKPVDYYELEQLIKIMRWLMGKVMNQRQKLIIVFTFCRAEFVVSSSSTATLHNAERQKLAFNLLPVEALLETSPSNM